MKWLPDFFADNASLSRRSIIGMYGGEVNHALCLKNIARLAGKKEGQASV